MARRLSCVSLQCKISSFLARCWFILGTQDKRAVFFRSKAGAGSGSPTSPWLGASSTVFDAAMARVCFSGGSLGGAWVDDCTYSWANDGHDVLFREKPGWSLGGAWEGAWGADPLTHRPTDRPPICFLFRDARSIDWLRACAMAHTLAPRLRSGSPGSAPPPLAHTLAPRLRNGSLGSAPPPLVHLAHLAQRLLLQWTRSTPMA